MTRDSTTMVREGPGPGAVAAADDSAASAASVTIGELAARAGVTPEAIRYYEHEGVLPAPSRAGAGRYRRYGAADVERLRFIRRARDLGFSLDEVRELLALAAGDPGRPCADVDRIARAHLADVETKLTRLAALRDELRRVIAGCRDGDAVADCRILGALGAPSMQARPKNS